MSSLESRAMFYRRSIIRPLRRRSNLGKLLAASDNPSLKSDLPKVRRWKIVSRLFTSDMMAEDTTDENKQTTRIRLYLALGAFGLSTVGMFGVPALTLITLPVQVYFVARFVQSGIVQVVQKHQVGMAVIDALVTSALLSLGYFWAISLYASFFLWSRSILQQIQNRYQDSIMLLASKPPQRVRILRNATEDWIGLDALDTDDTIVVYAGEIVPVDGVVIDGLAHIDQQFLTGEAQPVEREAGQTVLAMTLILSGSLQIHAVQTGSSTVSAHIDTLLGDIRSSTAALTIQSERIGNRYAVPMLVLSSGTLLLLGPISALTVLCSYVGYSLRITGPISVLNYLQLATQQGILVKDGQALETLHMIDTVIFDKTGTLTQEQPQVVNIYSYADHTEDDILALAAAAEQHQTHPIARALLQAADERQLLLASPSDVRYEPGVGVQIEIDGSVISIVSERFLERQGIAIPLCAEPVQAYSYQRGHSLVYVVSDTTVLGVIELAPTVRPESRQLVNQLQQQGKTVWIVSGDHEQPTRWLSHRLQADAYYANMLPPEKASLVARLQKEGKMVCFVGDGINDALALQQANVSISLSSAAGLALGTAQIIVPDTSLAQLLTLFDLSTRLHNRMQGNVACSIVPGVTTIAGVYLFHFGIVAAYILYYTGLMAGMGNAMLPRMLSDNQDISTQMPTSSVTD